LNRTEKALIDASSGGSLANKTLEEAWQLIMDVADANQHFKTRSTTSKSLFEVPSFNPKQGWRDNQPSRWNQQPQRQTYQNQQPSYTYNQPQNFQNQNPPYQQPYQTPPPTQQRYQPPHIRQNTPSHQTPPSQSTIEEALRPIYQENKELKDFQRRTETQLSTITDLLTRLTTQPTTNNLNTPQPSTSGGIPSQTLPNPKGSLNAISLSFEDTSSTSIPIATSSLHVVSFMKFILSLEDDQENEIVEIEVQKEARKDDCVMKVEDQVPTPSPKLVYEVLDTPQDIAISSLLALPDLIDDVPEKFGDLRPCLVDCKVGGEDLRGCM
ncbi:hypothetical protein PIB30_108810, partial [Stylosanthes scabra]|nr:hypothetical protein [Stylosanthes scabra]